MQVTQRCQPESLRATARCRYENGGDAFRAVLMSGLMVLASLAVLETQFISSASAEVTFLNKWGSEGSGDGQFYFPRGIAVSDTGHVYVVDSGNHRIQRFDAYGNYQLQ